MGKIIGYRFKILGNQGIIGTIYNNKISKGFKGNNPKGRKGYDNYTKMKPYIDAPGITKQDLVVLAEYFKNEFLNMRKENRKKVIYRNKTMIKDLVKSNIGQWSGRDKFVTVTFRRLPHTIEEADYQVKNFIAKLRYHYSKELQYLAIRELQKENDRNGIHYHIFIFNSPYMPQEELLIHWCKDNPYMDLENASGVNIQAIKQGLNQVINYLTGYTLKDLTEEDDFLAGRKIILKSKGLKKPLINDYESFEDCPFSSQTIKKGLSFLESKITYIEY